MNEKRKIEELLQQAEDLKCDLLIYMENEKREHQGVKSTMNELLDLMDELANERLWK